MKYKFGSLSAEACAKMLDDRFHFGVNEKRGSEPMHPIAFFVDLFEGKLLDLFVGYLKKEKMSEEDSSKLDEALSFYKDKVIPEWVKIRKKRGAVGNFLSSLLQGI